MKCTAEDLEELSEFFGEQIDYIHTLLDKQSRIITKLDAEVSYLNDEVRKDIDGILVDLVDLIDSVKETEDKKEFEKRFEKARANNYPSKLNHTIYTFFT